jgi:hypothetical protein
MQFQKVILMLLAFVVMSTQALTVIKYWKYSGGNCYYKSIEDQLYAMNDWCINFKSAMHASCTGDCQAIPPVIKCPLSKISNGKCAGHYWSTG